MEHEKVVLSDGKLRQLAYFTGLTEMVELVDEKVAKKEWRIFKKNDDSGTWAHGSLQNVKGTRHCLLYAEPPANVIAKAEAFKESLLASEAYRMASESAKSTKRHRVFELDGAELDIDRYLGQQDECWGRVTKGLQRPIVRLAVAVSPSCGNDENTFAGVTALATCCAILAEQAGCSLEVLCLMTTHNVKEQPETKEGCIVIPIKHADEPFHQNSLLCIGVPGIFRWYGFIVVHNAYEGSIHRSNSGQGLCYAMTSELREHLNIQHVLEVAWSNGRQQMFLDEFVKTLHDA